MSTRKVFLQQTGFALAGSLLPYFKLFANVFTPPNRKFVLDEYHPKECSIDLANHYQYTYSTNDTDSQIAVLNGFYSKPNPTFPVNTINPNDNDPEYALEGQYPLELQCDPLANDCRNTDFDGENPFRYTVYYPKPDAHNYTTTPLPCILIFHPGGFIECSDLLQPMMKQLCIEWARKGFIAFTVEYRRGRIKDSIATNTAVQQQMASYRAIQDGCGAIRSIIKKNRVGDMERFPFTINENEFFIGGASAGGVVAMGCAYYRTDDTLINDQTMIDDVFKKATGSTYSIKQVLGKMHSDYYYAPVNAAYWPVIKGVICMWSGVAIPKSFDGVNDKGASEKNFFKTTTEPWANPPMIAFAGDDDMVFHFYDTNDQDINLSPPPQGNNPNFYSENLCTNNNFEFKQNAVDGIELKMCSSLNMFNVLKKLNRFTELYLDCDMAHGLDKDCGPCSSFPNGTTYYSNCNNCTFDSEFGTFYTNQEQVIQYMAQRIAVFLQTIMYYTPLTGPPLTYAYKGRAFFKECKNSRRCDQTNNNSCPPGNDILCDGSALFTE